MSELHAPASQQRPRQQSRRWLVIGAVALGLLLTGFGGYFLGRRQPVSILDPLWLRGTLHRPLDHTGPGPGFWVTGYWVDYDRKSLDDLALVSPHLDQVYAFSYGLTPEGKVIGQDAPPELFGATNPKKIVLLVANMTDGKFSGPTARKVLTDPAARQAALDGMVAKVKALDAAGIQLDFEDIGADLRGPYTAFAKSLAEALHKEKATLSIAVPAKTADNPTSEWNGAFDYPALAQAVDQLVIMAYDEHYRLGDPGPVASLPWVDRVLRYATFNCPTGKLLLGVPGYGYDWQGKDGKAYGVSGMGKHLADVNAQVKWDEVMGEQVATYHDEAGKMHVAWFPDSRSLDAKLKLARQYNLKGVAFWRLGFEPQDYWQALGAARHAGS